jgi:hypothetical protein
MGQAQIDRTTGCAAEPVQAGCSSIAPAAGSAGSWKQIRVFAAALDQHTAYAGINPQFDMPMNKALKSRP